MKKLLLLLLAPGLFSACSTVKVSSDFDRTADFAAYKTYSFTEDARQLPVSDLNRKRVLDAVSNELAAEGFTESDDPQIWIDLKVHAEQKESATATTSSPYGSGYGYHWGAGFSTTTINVEEYLEGTLFVDMIDVAKKQLVWQGRAVGTLDPDADAEEREYNIDRAVKQVFTKYPPK